MVQCMSHLYSTFKDTNKKSKLFTQAMGLLDMLFKFYQKSPKQTQHYLKKQPRRSRLVVRVHTLQAAPCHLVRIAAKTGGK